MTKLHYLCKACGDEGWNKAGVLPKYCRFCGHNNFAIKEGMKYV